MNEMSSVWVCFELSFLSKHILYEGTTFRHVMHVSTLIYRDHYCSVAIASNNGI